MNLAQILKTLPPRVYLRSGELIIPSQPRGSFSKLLATAR